MCDAWAEKEPRIQVVHKPNGGLSSARNAGLEVATGEYILFVDSDDVLHPGICSRLLDALTTTGADISVCDAAHIFPGQVPQYQDCDQYTVLASQQAIEDMWYQKSFLPSAWAKLYRRSLWQDIRFTEGILYEDIDIMHLLFAQAKAVTYVPARLYGYNHREDSITTKPFGVRDLDILTIADKLVAYAEDSAPQLLPAAQSYRAVAAMRVVLNAPIEPELVHGIRQANITLKTIAAQVIRDPKIRRKTRYGLLLYRFWPALARAVHKRINRWK
jgi:glycosyltransferase involved in cell wall biosynthesis